MRSDVSASGRTPYRSPASASPPPPRVLVVQLNDVLQYVWGKCLGRRAIAPGISPHKTWEGLAGGVLSATAAGAALWWATPFDPAQAALLAFLVTAMGFAEG